MELQTMSLRFRVWDKDKKEFWRDKDDNGERFLAIRLDGILIDCSIFCEDNIMEATQERFVISQDTGLKADGTSVFIGDILRDDEGYLWIANYSDGACVATDSREHGVLEDLYLVARDSQIVGNIWQNYELLEDNTIDKS